ncbi:hypothetical protein EVS84_14810 [Pseudomonas koreensis]|uniref:Delta-60 repeat domain-containing protein n=2 Tax=Pseudomonas TaxID=286 RepID=A0A4Q4L347_9PSED|nr:MULTISPECIES: hypothetical protein [Pseudomonas]MDM8191058.1 hypothetical protein [Pseudomonas fluorescens]MDP8572303.1 hypothetical protein [Pseudomonas iranensis]RYM41167.1 hypothetical protein EVS84_14810 [Pseudomonas koreensis]
MADANAPKVPFPGDLDPDFGQRSLAVPGMIKTVVESIAVMTSEKILVCVSALDAKGLWHLYLWRLLANGDSDPAFGSDGCKPIEFEVAEPTKGVEIIAYGGGAFLLTGSEQDSQGNWKLFVALFRNEGDLLDLDFGDSKTGRFFFKSTVPAVEHASQCQLALAKSNPEAGEVDRVISVIVKGGVAVMACYLFDGTLWDGFADKGWFVVTLPEHQINVKGVRVLPNGRSLIYGWTVGVQKGFVIAIDSVGKPVPSFGKNGVVLLDSSVVSDSRESALHHIVPLSDGCVLVGFASVVPSGEPEQEPRQHGIMIKIDLDGQIDQKFKTVFTDPVDSKDLHSFINAFPVDGTAAGSIVGVGQKTGSAGRLLARSYGADDGDVDSSFIKDGGNCNPWHPIAACLHGQGVVIGGIDNPEVKLRRILVNRPVNSQPPAG